MKLFKTFFIAGSILLSFTTNAQDVPITFNELPANAQSFVNQYFKASDVSAVIAEDIHSDKEYKVYFHNGSKIEFRFNGDWEEVKNYSTGVPQPIIPKKIATYTKQNYPQAIITKLKKDYHKYEIELNNGLELEFTTNGDFLRIDD